MAPSFLSSSNRFGTTIRYLFWSFWQDPWAFWASDGDVAPSRPAVCIVALQDVEPLGLYVEDGAKLVGDSQESRGACSRGPSEMAWTQALNSLAKLRYAAEGDASRSTREGGRSTQDGGPAPTRPSAQ